MPFSSFSGSFGLNPGSAVVPGTVQALVRGNDLYLRGQKILLGLNRFGLCGGETAISGLSPGVVTSVTTPAWVYNPNGLSSSSTNPDYTFPGTPEDGFVLGVNGGTNIHNSRGNNTLGMSGTVTNLSSGRTLRGRWTGTFNNGTINLTLTNLYEFDVLGDFVRYTYTISNLSSTALTNVVFIRSLDPDNEQHLGGGFNTFNGTNNTSSISMSYGRSPGAVTLNGGIVPTIYFASFDTGIAQGGRGGFTISNAYSPGFTFTNNVGSETSVDEAIGMRTNIGTIPGGGSFSRHMYIGWWNSSSVPPNPSLPG
jgi:uncharacterized repeat protein (TIGR01451 family)